MVRALFEWKLSGLVEFTFTNVSDIFFYWYVQVILKEVDETFTDEELNGIISDVSENI